MIPKFPSGHPLGGADLPLDGSPGTYQVDAVLGIPRASRSAFIAGDWEQIAAEGDSLVEIPGNAVGMTQSWRRGEPDGDQLIPHDFTVSADARLDTASTRLYAEGFREALVTELH
jgi:hypothetical protein